MCSNLFLRFVNVLTQTRAHTRRQSVCCTATRHHWTLAGQEYALADSVAGSFTIDELRGMGSGDLQGALTC